MTIPKLPACMNCKHLDRSSVADFMAPGGLKCEAFPGGIPDPIRKVITEHRQPYAGDHGITFEQAPDRPPAYVEG